MATTSVTGLTSERMIAIEQSSVVSGEVRADGHLELETRGGSTIDAGFVKAMEVVRHGTNANAPRPNGAPAVYWIGTAIPVNGEPWDFLLKENI